jgi:hypothetical protein
MSRKQLIEFFATFRACTSVMEACAGSHHMARKLAVIGHTVKLISPRRSIAHLQTLPFPPFADGLCIQISSISFGKSLVLSQGKRLTNPVSPGYSVVQITVCANSRGRRPVVVNRSLKVVQPVRATGSL